MSQSYRTPPKLGVWLRCADIHYCYRDIRAGVLGVRRDVRSVAAGSTRHAPLRAEARQEVRPLEGHSADRSAA